MGAKNLSYICKDSITCKNTNTIRADFDKITKGKIIARVFDGSVTVGTIYQTNLVEKNIP